ncbi:MAG TPA: endonuclease domain-containing protein [Rhizomicrobium sp.]|nr:endonuclease domain-containing protein [Rhizomicrobium sp.]
MRNGEERSRKFAKQLRQELTGAEIILWSRLRRGQLAGRKFRRQHPIGPYVADFACIEARVVVEVDGATHSTEAEREHDRVREGYLKKSGWKVLHVFNEDVYKRLNDVLNLICIEVPPPRPSAGPPPQAGEERNARDTGE